MNVNNTHVSCKINSCFYATSVLYKNKEWYMSKHNSNVKPWTRHIHNTCIWFYTCIYNENKDCDLCFYLVLIFYHFDTIYTWSKHQIKNIRLWCKISQSGKCENCSTSQSYIGTFIFLYWHIHRLTSYFKLTIVNFGTWCLCFTNKATWPYRRSKHAGEEASSSSLTTHVHVIGLLW